MLQDAGQGCSPRSRLVNRIAVIAAAAFLGGSAIGLSATAPRAQTTDTPAGTYAQSCSNAYVSQGRLYAQCLDMAGRRFSTSIEVAPCAAIASDIGNDDGLLVCQGLRGRRENSGGGGRDGGRGDDRDRDRDWDRDRGGGWGGGGGGGSRGPLVDYNLAATYGTFSFYGGYYEDPLTVRGYSGGEVRASDVAQTCQGFVSRAPDAKITYTATRQPLIFSVASDGDTTLLINGPDGRWYCDDDGGNYGLNPALRFDRPMSGTYDVWIGSYDANRNDDATLYVSERTSQ